MEHSYPLAIIWLLIFLETINYRCGFLHTFSHLRIMFVMNPNLAELLIMKTRGLIRVSNSDIFG